MSGKGAKGLIMGKSPAINKDKDKDKKKPISRSSRAGLQVQFSLSLSLCVFSSIFVFSSISLIFFMIHSWVNLRFSKYALFRKCVFSFVLVLGVYTNIMDRIRIMVGKI